MNTTVSPGHRTGEVTIPSSKSAAHRLLLCAALGKERVRVRCRGISKDIAATIDCLNALGASISAQGEWIDVTPIQRVPTGERRLPCGESGSTLRFLLPLVGALGAQAVFVREGRLPQRPLHPLDDVLRAHGMTLREDGALLHCAGQLTPGEFSLPGDVSSQYISGLLMALPLLPEQSRLHITGKIESAAYITMTEDALREGGIAFAREGAVYQLPGAQRPSFPPELAVEGDFSGAAFFLCIGALSTQGVTVHGLREHSSQGDRAVLDILETMGAQVERCGESVTVRRGSLHGCTIDAAPIPDLIPVLSTLAAVADGETRVLNAGRLRLKESDRLQTTAQLLRTLGAQITEQPEGLTITGCAQLTGGTVDSCDDHRIAMSAAVAACAASAAVTVQGSECVQKSYPGFWHDLDALKGESR